MRYVHALSRLLSSHHLITSCTGAALAPLTDRSMHSVVRDAMSDPRKDIVAVVCGGNGVSLELLAQWRQQFID